MVRYIVNEVLDRLWNEFGDEVDFFGDEFE